MCPRLLLAAWPSAVIAAMSWWEQGALGVSYLEAPTWLGQAFGIISRERMDAHAYRRELERRSST